MPVAVDQAGDDDGVDCIDHLRIRGVDLGRDRGNFAAFDQQIAFREVADLGVHADDGAAFEQNAALRIDGLLAVEAANIVGERGAGKSVGGGRACGKRSAGLERTAARYARVTRHGRSSLGFY